MTETIKKEQTKGVRVVGIGHRIDEEAKVRAEQWLSLLEVPFELVILPQYRIETILKPWDVVIAFGKLPYTIASQAAAENSIPLGSIIELPPLSKLTKISENIEPRKQALSSIEALKTAINEGKLTPVVSNIKVGDLDAVDSQKLLILKQGMEVLGQSRFILRSKAGVEIEVAATHNDFATNASIKLTIEELLLILEASKIFKVEEVDIWKLKPQNSTPQSIK